MINEQQHRKIRATMMLANVKFSQIAKQEKVTTNYVTYVVTGRRQGYRIRKAISEACGVPYLELWPDEEDEDLPKAA